MPKVSKVRVGKDSKMFLEQKTGHPLTVTQADRGENQSMNNQPKYNEGGSHLTEGKTREKSLRFPHCQ